MVACAAVSVQLSCPDWMQPQSAGCSAVDQLKQQLLLAVENENVDEANDVLAKLEKSGMTKEILEVTRVGAAVNDVRKRMVESAPQLSKRCRALIKCWQKLADPRPTSSCGSHSNSATPNLVSPVVRRGLTPGTPARGRLTSAALSTGSRSSLTSPAVSSPSGSYAPPQNRCSPRNGAVVNMHKSFSVGSDLTKRVTDDVIQSGQDDILRNGKRKAENAHHDDSGLLNGFGADKRSKGGSAVASPATGPHSVVAARRANVQPTSELVAQLSENLPRYMAINLSERESQLKREQDQQSQAQQQHGSLHPAAPSPAVSSSEISKKKERKGRSSKKSAAEQEQLQTFADTTRIPIQEEKTTDERQSVASEGTTSNTVTVPTRHGRFEWSAILPTLDTLRHREEFKATQSDDPSKSYVVSVHGRKVLALPYVDTGVPDFLQYEYPQSTRFYAEENFMYGAPRPS